MSAPQTHSPLPWRLYNGWGPARDGLMRVERIGPACGGGLHTNPDSQDIAGTREDLEFIVTACNAHHALVEACKLALAEGPDAARGPRRAAIEAAIAKAEGASHV